MITNEQKEQLQSVMRKVETANGFRLIFLFVGLLLLLFLYFGNKMFADAAWFIRAGGIAFKIAEWDVVLIVITTFVKLYFSLKYNRLLKKD